VKDRAVGSRGVTTHLTTTTTARNNNDDDDDDEDDDDYYFISRSFGFIPLSCARRRCRTSFGLFVHLLDVARDGSGVV